MAKQEATGTSIALDSSSQYDEDEKLIKEDEDAHQPASEESIVKQKNILRLVDASFTWNRGSPNVLHNINLVIPNGHLTIIMGIIYHTQKLQ